MTLNLKSGTDSIPFPTKFNDTDEAKKFLERLAGASLDQVVQDISKKMGGVVLQQSIKNEAYQNYTVTKLKTGNYEY